MRIIPSRLHSLPQGGIDDRPEPPRRGNAGLPAVLAGERFCSEEITPLGKGLRRGPAPTRGATQPITAVPQSLKQREKPFCHGRPCGYGPNQRLSAPTRPSERRAGTCHTAPTMKRDVTISIIAKKRRRTRRSAATTEPRLPAASPRPDCADQRRKN